MKFSKAELAAICLTAGTLLFLSGWFLRGAWGGQRYTLSAAHPRQAAASPSAQVFVPDVLVDVNTATLEELMTLPGVGETRAQAILDHREAEGPFSYPEDLMDVSGIGRSTFEQLANYITTSP